MDRPQCFAGRVFRVVDAGCRAGLFKLAELPRIGKRDHNYSPVGGQSTRAPSALFLKLPERFRLMPKLRWANQESKLISFAARQEPQTLKVEMDERIKNARFTSLSDTEEWREFETAFEAYWAKINSKEAIDWFAERDRMVKAIAGLEHYVRASWKKTTSASKR